MWTHGSEPTNIFVYYESIKREVQIRSIYSRLQQNVDLCEFQVKFGEVTFAGIGYECGVSTLS